MSFRHHIKKILLCSVIAGLMPVYAAQAAGTDPLIEGAKLCTRHLARYEREYGVPTHLLSAIASTESGRYHDGLKIKVPWPWTINVEGKGYFFDTKDAAILAVRKFKAQGAKSIDVGCMQVNLQQHPQAFLSLEEAFEPETNIAYAASFLRSLYNEESSWKRAAADYHSRTPALGKEYVGEVYDSWYRIISKLRAARLQVPDSSVVAMNEMGSESGARPAVMKTYRPAYMPPHMNSIQISNKESDPSFIVIKPEISVANDAPAKATAPTPVAVQTAAVVANPAPATLAMAQAPVSAQGNNNPDPNAIMVGNQRLPDLPVAESKKTGPTFIFND